MQVELTKDEIEALRIAANIFIMDDEDSPTDTTTMTGCRTAKAKLEAAQQNWRSVFKLKGKE